MLSLGEYGTGCAESLCTTFYNTTWKLQWSQPQHLKMFKKSKFYFCSWNIWEFPVNELGFGHVYFFQLPTIHLSVLDRDPDVCGGGRLALGGHVPCVCPSLWPSQTQGGAVVASVKQTSSTQGQSEAPCRGHRRWKPPLPPCQVPHLVSARVPQWNPKTHRLLKTVSTLMNPQHQPRLSSFGVCLLGFGQSAFILPRAIIQYALEWPSNQLFYFYLKF